MSAPSSSSSSDEEEQFLEDGKVVENLEKEKEEVEELVKPKRTLDDLIVLRWYTLKILCMSEFMAFTALASTCFMMFGGVTPNVVACDNTPVENCEHFYDLRNRTGCSPVLDYQFTSVQVEFNYICEEAKKVKNTITVQTFGILVGAAFFGQFSDNFGRRKALIVSAIGTIIMNIIAAYSHDLTWFMIWRTIAGVFSSGFSVVQMVFMVETIPIKHRMWIQNSITWSPNMVLFPYIAYLAQNWRNLSLVVSFASFLSLIALLLVEESPRWMIQKNRLQEARDSLIRIRKFDRLYDEEFEKEIDDVIKYETEKISKSTKKGKKYTFIHLFCTWKMIAQTMTFFIGIVSTTFIVYALMYNMEKLSGSLYWNSAIIGMARWTVNIIVSILDYKFKWFGRKMVNQISMISTIASLAIMAGFVYYGHAGKIQAIGTVIACSMCSQLFIAKYLTVQELYPTAIRNLAVSAVSTVSRIGSMFAPQLFYLSDYSEFLPYVVMFFMQVLDLILFTAVIPETKGVHLQNHLPPKHKRIFGKRS